MQCNKKKAKNKYLIRKYSTAFFWPYYLTLNNYLIVDKVKKYKKGNSGRMKE